MCFTPTGLMKGIFFTLANPARCTKNLLTVLASVNASLYLETIIISFNIVETSRSVIGHLKIQTPIVFIHATNTTSC